LSNTIPALECWDYGPGQPVKFQPLPGQHGMARINGGPQVLVDGLLAQLPAGVLRTGQCVTAISQDSSGVEVEAGAETFFCASGDCRRAAQGGVQHNKVFTRLGGLACPGHAGHTNVDVRARQGGGGV
jgi:hypothetical protein